MSAETPAVTDVGVKVYVSSTWEDLQPERLAVERTVHRMAELAFAGMEYFGASPQSAHDESLERIEGCQVYVGIFGGRYGSGITEAEYRRARELGLPCYVYFKTDSVIPPEQREKDPDKALRLAALKTELRDSFHGHLSADFSTPDGLAAQVGTDLHNWLFEKYLAPRLTGAAQAGHFPEIRALVAQTLDSDALRGALERAGVAVGDDPVDGLLALGGPIVLQVLVQGTAKLPTDYDARFRNYFIEYLGTAKKAVPFGGRSQALENLDAWLDDPASPPYLLLTAGAGRGKSALLVHWGRKLLTRGDVAVIHLPVSIRFRTNLAAVVFASLAAQLADAHGEAVPAEINTSVEVWRGIVSDYLQRPLPDGRRLVVILDGLDEAADWQAGADLFPLQPPPGLRLLVSARHTAEAPDADAWRRRLGWDDPALARALPLEALDTPGVGDVLSRMGFPLNELGQRIDIVAELYRLSEGDPLLVRLYVEDLWKRGTAAARLRPEDLRTIRPGLEGYFDRWWKEQRELWGKDAPLQEKGVQALLGVLTCAFGPLTRDDLLAVVPEEAGLTSWTLADALLPVSRFIVGDGEEAGYVFSHPKFGLYLYVRLTANEKKAWDGRFIAWGKDVLARLGGQRLAPRDAPSYLVQYLGSHLERAEAPLEDLLALVSAPWKLAWAALEGSFSGFLSDIDRASRAAAELDRRAVQEGRPASHLADEIYLALCRASTESLAYRVSPFLLGRLLDEQIWTPAQALSYARRLPEPAQRAEALGRAALHLPPDRRAAVDREALDIVSLLPSPRERASLLARLVALTEPPPLHELSQALRQAEIPLELPVSDWLAAAATPEGRRNLAEMLPPFLDPGLRRPASVQAPQRISELAGELLHPADPEEALKHLMTQVDDVSELERILEELHGKLPEEAWQGLVQSSLSLLRPDVFGEDWPKLNKLSRHLSGPLLGDALSRLTSIGDLIPRALAQAWLGSYCPKKEPDPILDRLIAEIRSRPFDASKFLFSLGLLGPPEIQLRLLPDVLRLKEQKHASMFLLLEYIASSYPEPEKLFIRREAWEFILKNATIKDLLDLATTGERDAPETFRGRLPLPELTAAATERRTIEERLRSRSWLLHLLPTDERANQARLIAADAKFDLGPARLSLRYLSEPEVDQMADEWLRHPDEKARCKAIVNLAPHLSLSKLKPVLDVVRAIGTSAERVQALAALFPRLSAEEQREILQEGLTGEIAKEWFKIIANFSFNSTDRLFTWEQADALQRTLRREMSPSVFERLVVEEAPGENRGDGISSVIFLMEIASDARELDHQLLLRTLQRLLQPGMSSDRSEFLLVIAVFAPVLATLAGESSVPALKAAVEAACTLFP